jgi:hypothetical protein
VSELKIDSRRGSFCDVGSQRSDAGVTNVSSPERCSHEPNQIDLSPVQQ